MSNSLLDVIKEVFNTYNYNVSVANQGFDLIAKKSNNTVAIKLADDPTTDDIKQFIEAFRGNSTMGLVITMGCFSEDIKKLAKQKDLMLWDRTEFERQIGKAVLLGFESKSSPFFDSDVDVTNQVAQPEKKPAKKDISALTEELYSGAPEKQKPQSTISAKVIQKPEPEPGIIAGENAAGVKDGSEIIEADSGVVAADEDEPPRIPLHTIPMKIKSSDAIKIAGNIGRAEDVECALKFIPFWKYDYSLDVIAKYKDITVPLSGKGSRVINAINKNVTPAPTVKPVEAIEIPDAPYNIEMTILTQEEANAMAMKAIIDEHSKTLRFKGTQGEAAIVEHKRFSPKPSDIDIRMELLYIPFWAVRSHKGYMEINAYDGKPTQMPIDDGAEIL